MRWALKFSLFIKLGDWKPNWCCRAIALRLALLEGDREVVPSADPLVHRARILLTVTLLLHTITILTIHALLPFLSLFQLQAMDGYGYGGGGGGLGLLLLLLLGGGSILPIVLFYLMRSRISAGGQGYGGYTNGYSNGYNGGHSNGGYSNGYDGYDSYGYTGNREIDNDTVTVTRLQVALLSQARYIQDSLTEYTLNADTDTTEGLTELLQESVLALLRSPENWSHVRVNSQTVKSREQATQLFEQISIEERSKFSAETLANVGGRVRRQAMPKNEDDAPASYIVVTLVLGTADDRPLFDEKIRTTQELQAALQRLGSITPEYLLVFELLWSPQDASDSLTYDELLTEYPGLIQI